MMTDGVQTKDPKDKRSVTEILAEAAQPLKDKGVRVISLGIGQRVDRASLQTIATGDYVFSARSFNDLRRMVRDLKKGTCEGMKLKNVYFLHDHLLPLPCSRM